MKTYHIVKGTVTNPDVWAGRAILGQTEYQFSDGPAGKRGSSYDFLTLEDGLRELSPAIFIHED